MPVPNFSDLQYNAQQNPQQWGAANASMLNPGMSQAYGPFGQQFTQTSLGAFGPSFRCSATGRSTRNRIDLTITPPAGEPVRRSGYTLACSSDP